MGSVAGSEVSFGALGDSRFTGRERLCPTPHHGFHDHALGPRVVHPRTHRHAAGAAGRSVVITGDPEAKRSAAKPPADPRRGRNIARRHRDDEAIVALHRDVSGRRRMPLRDRERCARAPLRSCLRRAGRGPTRGGLDLGRPSAARAGSRALAEGRAIDRSWWTPLGARGRSREKAGRKGENERTQGTAALHGARVSRLPRPRTLGAPRAAEPQAGLYPTARGCERVVARGVLTARPADGSALGARTEAGRAVSRVFSRQRSAHGPSCGRKRAWPWAEFVVLTNGRRKTSRDTTAWSQSM